MKSRLIAIIISILILAIAHEAYSEVTESEAISYCSKAAGISSEILTNFFGGNYKLLGEVSDTLGAFDIIDKMKSADDKGAVLSAANFGSMKIISKVIPKGASILTAFDVYCTSLVIIRDYVWIPRIKDKVYQKYKENRNAEANPEEALLGVQRYIHLIMADVKKRNIYPRYNLDIIASKELRKQTEDRINNEAIKFMEAMFEERYNREKLIKAVHASKDAVKKSMDKTLEKLKEKITMTIQGDVRDRESKSLSLGGARVWVQGYKIGTLSNRAGIFQLEVPYKIVGDRPFRIGVRKEGYKPALSNKSLSFRDKKIQSLTCYLTPLKKEKKVIQEKPYRPPPSRGQDRRRER